MIAMALANRPDVLIADEPTTALDVTVQAQILHLIDDLKARYGMGVVLITHDLTVVRQFADHVYVMQHGEVREHNRPSRSSPPPAPLHQAPARAPTPRASPTPATRTPRPCSRATTSASPSRCAAAALFRGTNHDLQAVDGLTLDLKRGETLGIVGESGSGKTTFGMALMRIGKLTSGRVVFLGQDIEAYSRRADAAPALADADRLPGPLRLAQPAHVGAARSSRRG